MGRRLTRWLAALVLVLAYAAMTQAQGPWVWRGKEQPPATSAAPARAVPGHWSDRADYQRLLAAVEENSRSLRHDQLYRLMHQQRRGY